MRQRAMIVAAAVLSVAPLAGKAADNLPCSDLAGEERLVCVCETVWGADLQAARKAPGTDAQVTDTADGGRRFLVATDGARTHITCTVHDGRFVDLGYSTDSMERNTPGWSAIIDNSVDSLNAYLLRLKAR